MKEQSVCGKCGNPLDEESGACSKCGNPSTSKGPLFSGRGRLSLARLYSGRRRPDLDHASQEDEIPDPEQLESDEEVRTQSEMDDSSEEMKTADLKEGENILDDTDILAEETEGVAEEDEKISELDGILSGISSADEQVDLDAEKGVEMMPAVPVRADTGKLGRADHRIRTYVNGFDELLDGGIPSSSIVLLTGEAGTMKSSLAYYILYKNILNVGAKCLYVSLEQTIESILNQMYSMGMDPQLTRDSLRLFDLGYIRKYIPRSKKDWFEMFMENITNIHETRGFDILVIDSLEALEVIAEFKNRRVDLFRLFEWLRDLGATVFLIAERSECPLGQHLSHPKNEEGFLADGIISLSLHPTNEIDIQRRIRCIKMRGTRHETGYLSLMWDEGQFKVAKAIGR